MTEAPLRLAVSGAGRASERLYLPALQRVPGLTIAGVADPDAGRAASVPGAVTAGTLDELLAICEADCVLVLSPPEAHVSDALAALQRGLPVLVEKPACQTVAEADTLAAAGADELLTPAFTRRAWPAYRAIQKAGGPRYRAIIGIRTDPAGWDAVDGASPLADDLLPHAVDLARWLCGAEVRTVDVAVRETSIRLTMRMCGGQDVQCRVARGAGYREVVRIDGHTFHIGPPPARAALVDRAMRRPAPAVRATAATVQAWLARVRGEDVAPWLPSFADARAVAEVLEQVATAAD